MIQREVKLGGRRYLRVRVKVEEEAVRVLVFEGWRPFEGTRFVQPAAGGGWLVLNVAAAEALGWTLLEAAELAAQELEAAAAAEHAR